jgi:hypothetical protein
MRKPPQSTIYFHHDELSHIFADPAPTQHGRGVGGGSWLGMLTEFRGFPVFLPNSANFFEIFSVSDFSDQKRGRECGPMMSLCF